MSKVCCHLADVAHVHCTWRACGLAIQRTEKGTVRDGLLAHLDVVHQVTPLIAETHVTNRLGPAS